MLFRSVSHDVDLVNNHPVPAPLGDGHYDWETVYLGKGASTANLEGTGGFNLYVVDVTIARFANKIQVLDGAQLNLAPPNLEPKAMLPHWTFRVILHNESGHNGLKMGWYLYLARALTV